MGITGISGLGLRMSFKEIWKMGFRKADFASIEI